jgi:predicted AlkP superfamily phosphohydrolase/phosphomutase
MSRTLLIGLDGATFSILDPMMEAGVMPFLKEFVGRGVRAELLSTPNPLTAQAWPSMFTGRSPGHHGIFDFVRFQERPRGAYFTPTNAQDLRCETVWSIASRKDRTVTALNFYGLWPPQPVAGYTMAGFVSWRHMKDAVYPPELYERVKALPNFDRKELAKDLDLERKCILGLPPEEYAEWITLYTRKDRQWFDILRHLMSSDPTDLTAIVFDGMDKLQHLCWRFLLPELLPPNPSAWERDVRDLCLGYFRQIDEFIAEAVALAGPDTQVYMASDHGFGTSTEVFYVNVWLERHGYLTWAGETEHDELGRLTSERLSGNVNAIDWSRTTAYAMTSSSNGIFIRVAKEEGQPGVRPEEYEAVRRRLTDELLGFTDPADGGRVVTRVRTREEAYPGGQMHHAPDLLLTLRDGGFVSVLNADAPLKPRAEPAGTHRPAGFFAAGGRGIREGLHSPELSILDVAPILLYSLGLPIPEDMEGRLPEHIMEPSFLREHPPRVESSAPPAGQPAEPALKTQGDTQSEAEIIEKLMALGYLE